MKEYTKQYYENNREKILEQSKQWRKDNPERRKELRKNWCKSNPEYDKQWRKNNPEKVKEQKKRYREENPSMFLESSRKWHKNNPEYKKEYYRNNLEKWKIYNKDRKEYQKEWFKNHPKKVKIYNKLRTKKRNLDLKLNLSCKIGTMMRNSLNNNKNGRHWETLVDYTLNDLKNWLQKTIPKGCTWQDYSRGKLHIDHIIPIRAFVFNNPDDEEFKQCWSLNNLRLLTAEQNLIKNDSIDNPILLGLLLKEII